MEKQKMINQLVNLLAEQGESQVINFKIERLGEANDCSVEIKSNAKFETEFIVKAYAPTIGRASLAAQAVYDFLRNKYGLALPQEVALKIGINELKKEQKKITSEKPVQRLDLPKDKLNLADMANKAKEKADKEPIKDEEILF